MLKHNRWKCSDSVHSSTPWAAAVPAAATSSAATRSRSASRVSIGLWSSAPQGRTSARDPVVAASATSMSR